MAYIYCRAYGWPYRDNRWELTKEFYKKVVGNSQILDLPCNIGICYAYQDKDYPFVLIATDIEASIVFESEISQKMTNFVECLGNPQPESLENPYVLKEVNSNYPFALMAAGYTTLESYYIPKGSRGYTVSATLIDSHDSSSADDKSVGRHKRKWWQFWKNNSSKEDYVCDGKTMFVKERIEGSYTYFDYKADSEDDAIRFLKDKSVTDGCTYHQVYLHDCLIGKDNIGMYKQERKGDGWGEVQPIEYDKTYTKNDNLPLSRSRDYSNKKKRCLGCNSELKNGQLQCQNCGSEYFIWE